MTLLLLGACGSGQAGVDRALQRMYQQPKADAYESSPIFPDGKVMQSAPAGTIAREDVVDLGPAMGLDSAGRYLDRIPVPMTPPLLAGGRARFRIVCGACHGAGGFGGSVVAENWWPPRPPSLRDGRAAELSAGQLYQVIRSGFGRMPGYANDLPVADRWAIVAYAIAIRHRPPADSGERADSARAQRLQQLDSLRQAASR